MAPKGLVTRNPGTNNELYIRTNFASEIPSYIGRCDDACGHCDALHWFGERPGASAAELACVFSTCCRAGAVTIPSDYTPSSYPNWAKQLPCRNDQTSKDYQKQLRSYNNAMCFASLGANVDYQNQLPGVFSFRVSGTLYHNLPPILPASGDEPRFSQIYVLGGNDELEVSRRIQAASANLNPSVVQMWQDFLNRHNPYAQVYRTATTVLPRGSTSTLALRSVTNPNLDLRVYNAPTYNEVAMVIRGSDTSTIAPRDIALHLQGGGIIRITDKYTGYLALCFPIFFPFGEQGWIENWTSTTNRNQPVTQCEWYCHMIFDCTNSFSPLLRGKRLFQEILVDMYICVERRRLEYIKFHQREIRADLYQGLADSIRDDSAASGRRVVLPSSFSGSPRHMVQLYQDSMANVRQFGKPSLFITMTANPRWPEVVAALKQGEDPADCPDLVTRVFKLKLYSLIEDLYKNERLGKIDSYVYTIEFQKRGLPHAHIMIILASSFVPSSTTSVDCLVSAELPDPVNEPLLHKLVTNNMLHGPCEARPCWKDGKCSKNFPKPFCESTAFVNGSYPNYRRPDNGRYVIKHGRRFGNEYVVPYNKYLLLRYQCHINVEIPYGIAGVKYLFKYICKGHDRSALDVTENDETVTYVNGRYIGPSEAAWRMLQFPLSDRYPPVQRLAVHTEANQTLYFTDEESLQRQFDTGRAERTTLNQYFYLNRANTIGLGVPARSLLYQEIPKYFLWKSTNEWAARRRASDMVGRIYFASVEQGEHYYIQLILLHRKGATSFADLRTVNGRIHSSFRSSAEAMGLLVSDAHYNYTVREAALWMTGPALRTMFTVILIHSAPSQPQLLLERNLHFLSEDCPYIMRTKYPMIEPTDLNLASLLLYLLSQILDESGKSFQELGLDDPDRSLWRIFSGSNRENVPPETWCVRFNTSLASLNAEQSQILQDFKEMYRSGEGSFLFIDGPGGCGKTFLMNTIISLLKSKSVPVIVVASSGVAALMLHKATTAHHCFKIPLTVEAKSICKWEPNSAATQILKDAHVIIWDEVSMQHRHAIEAVDRTFQDVLQSELPFGGKLVIFGGDFRQTLPVVRLGNIYDQAEACITNSYFWRGMVRRRLSRNFRILGNSPSEESVQFSKWILAVGSGALQDWFASDIELIFGSLIQHHDQSFVTRKLIDKVFPNMIQVVQRRNPDELLRFFAGRLILTALNVTVADINSICLDLFPGECVFSRGKNLMETLNDEAIPDKSLDRISFPGFLETELKLKIGVPVMLMRNLNLAEGLCNGTRMIITGIQHHVLCFKLLTGPLAGNKFLIPKIKLIHEADYKYGATFSRYQFPIVHAFCLTINKSQGQSLDHVGVYLPKPVFGHGQLYVALSRVKAVENLHIGVMNQTTFTPHTLNVVHLDLIQSACA